MSKRRLFLHFFDIHFLKLVSAGRAAETVQKECSLATRLALLWADEVVLPASSFFESEVCRRVILEFSELFELGAIWLTGGGVNVVEFAERKLSGGQYSPRSSIGANYRRPASGQAPPFLPRARSSTVDIGTHWKTVVDSGVVPELLRRSGTSNLGAVEKLWPDVPEMLGSKAFIGGNVAPLLLGKNCTTAGEHQLDSVINEAYFGSYTSELECGVLTDLVFLRSPHSIPVSGPCLNYQQTVRRMVDAGLRDRFLAARPHELVAFRHRPEWARIFHRPDRSAAENPIVQYYTRRDNMVHEERRGEEPLVADTADVVVVCALAVPELSKVREAGGVSWTELPASVRDPHSYLTAQYTTHGGTPLKVVAGAPNHMGLAASAVLAAKMILRFQPKLVAMVGIAAGSNNEKQGFGDILAAQHTFDYGSGKVVKDGEVLRLVPDPNPLAVDTRLIQRLKNWSASRRELNDIYERWQAQKPRTVLSMHVGPLGSGAAVLDSRDPIEEVQKHWRKLIGIEMEAYAVHRACEDASSPPPKFLCFKSVCDFAEGKDDHWQEYAAYTSAELFHRFVRAEWEALFPTA